MLLDCLDGLGSVAHGHIVVNEDEAVHWQATLMPDQDLLNCILSVFSLVTLEAKLL